MKAHRKNLFLASSRNFCGAVVAAISLGAAQAQTTGTWNYNGTVAASNNWNTVASWTGLAGGLVPNAVGATANFSSLNITGARTIPLNGDKIVGSISFEDLTPNPTYQPYTLSAGTPTTSRLIFDVVSGSTASITTPTGASAANHSIGVGIQLNDPLVITTTRTNTLGGVTLDGVIADGSGSFSITKEGNGSLTLVPANTYDGGTIINAGRIVANNTASMGSGLITVNDDGQFYMNTAGTFANDLSIAGDGYTNTADAGALAGALRYQSSTTTGTITLTGNARIGGWNGSTGTIAGPLTGGAFDLEINSTLNANHNGNIVLTGNASGLTGTVTVSRGTLRLGPGSNLGGSLVVSDGTNLYPENVGTAGSASILGNVTLGNSGSTTTGANLFIDPSSTEALQTGGDLTLNGITTVNLISPITSSSIKVIGFAGTLTGSASNLTLQGGLTGFRFGTGFRATSNEIIFDVVLGAVTWTGAISNDWDSTTENWTNGAPSTFFNADAVTFDDSSVFTSVTIPTGVTVAPRSVLLNHSTVDYSIGGSGTLQAGSLTKDGTGLATLSAPWSIAGPITLTAGFMQFSPAASTTGTLSTNIAGNGTLVKGGAGILSITQANMGFTGPVVISKGELTMGNVAALGAPPEITFGNADTLSSDVTRLTLPTTGAVDAAEISVTANTLDARILSTGGTLSNATIIKRGSGRLRIGHPSTLGTRTNYVTGNSSITIEAGTLAGASEIPISSTTTVTMGNSSTGTAPTILELPANQTTNNDVVTLSCPLVLSPDAPNSEAIFRYAGGSSSGSLSYNGPISLNGRDIYFENTSTLTGNTPSRLYNVQSVISGNGNVRIRAAANTDGSASGAGRMRLQSSSNSWNGDLIMDRGMVQIGLVSECIPNNARILFAAGTSVTVFNNTETVRGLVGGAATETVPFAANYSVSAGSVLAHTLIITDTNSENTHFYSGTIANGSPTGSTVSLEKNGSSTQVLAGANGFSGNIIINGGKLIGQGAQNSGGGVSVLGSRVNTRTITINDGGTLQFNSGNILSSTHVGITAPTLVINSGGTVTNGGTATNNALNNIELNGGTLTSTTGHTSSAEPFAPLYGAYNLNGTVTSTGDSTISTSDPAKGWLMLKVPDDKITNFNVLSGTLTVSAPVGQDIDNNNIGGLSKSGVGTMVMSGVNFYTGSTTVSEGTLSLADNAQLKFVLGASSGVNNSISGTGTVVLDGDFVIDTTAADSLSSGTWTLENVPSLTGAYGSTFTVIGWTDAGNNQWTKMVGGTKTYTFDETTGVVTLESQGYPSWAAVNAISSAANLDKDGDGVANAVEYVLGGDVNTNDLDKLPTLNASGANLVFSFKRDRDSIDGNTVVKIEVGNDLSSWPNVFDVGTTTANSSNGVTVAENTPTGFDTITLTVSKGTDTKKFGRLKVTVTE